MCFNLLDVCKCILYLSNTLNVYCGPLLAHRSALCVLFYCLDLFVIVIVLIWTNKYVCMYVYFLQEQSRVK